MGIALRQDPARRVAELRRQSGLSLQQLAERIGCTKSQISKIENGYRRVTPDWARRLADALDVEPDELMPEDPPVHRLGRGLPERPLAVRGPVPAAPEPVRGTVPVLGFGRVTGSQGGVFLDPEESPEETWCPPPLAGLPDAYAVRMPDTSMMPKYRPDQMLWVHPYRVPEPGDPVVVRLRNRSYRVALFSALDEASIAFQRLNRPALFEIDRREVLAVERIAFAEER